MDILGLCNCLTEHSKVIFPSCKYLDKFNIWTKWYELICLWGHRWLEHRLVPFFLCYHTSQDIYDGWREKNAALGKGPKIKKPESMVFDHISLTPSPPNLNYGLFSQNFKDLH